MKWAFRLLRRFVHERRLCRFYAYDPRQGTGQADARIRIYSTWAELPEAVRRVALPRFRMNAMYYRMRRGEARLLCHSEDGKPVDAYGWIQGWRPFQRKFAALARDGLMLGPYWTAPEARGHGLYGRLLGHSLSVCLKDRPILIYTSPDNSASQRGIAKAGLQPCRGWQLHRREASVVGCGRWCLRC